MTFGSEVYDPESGTWSSSGTMTKDFAAGELTATLLRDGKVLVYGPSGAQLYDPDSGTWSATGTMIDTASRPHSHVAARRQGARGGWVLRREGMWLRPGGRARAVRPGHGIVDRDRELDARRPEPALRLAGQPAAGWHPAPHRRLGQPATTRPAEPGAHSLGGPSLAIQRHCCPMAPCCWLSRVPHVPPRRCTTRAPGPATSASSMLRCESAVGAGPLFTLLRDGTVLAAGAASVTARVCVFRLARPSCTSLPACRCRRCRPSRARPRLSSRARPRPDPDPPLPPAVGPVPPNARCWTVTVDNRSSEPATLFVARGRRDVRLVGSATPNVVPAGATVQVTFLFPADGTDGST